MKNYELGKKFSKLLINLLKIVRPSAGTSLPGKIMMNMCPEFLKIESQKIQDKIVCVTGTNGKTTSCGILASILKETQNAVLHNAKGANMPQGIATTFLQNGDNQIDYGVFECDEAWLYSIAKSIKMDFLLVTNLFPDQTERYGGVNALAKRIKSAIDLNPDLKIILNADDPHLLPLKTENTVFYSVEEIKNNMTEITVLPEICPCGAELVYEKRFYAHLGDFKCNNCHLRRETPNYSAVITLNDNNTEITVNDELTFKSNLVGIYNAYNILGVIATNLEIGIDKETIQKGLDNYKNIFGRVDKFEVKGKTHFIQLIKNPVGTNQAIKLIKDDIKSKLFILLNDTPADGRDISWLYDTDFEYFKQYPNEIILSGTKANALAVRLKHAGLNEKQFFINQNVKEAYKHALNVTAHNETLYILANFTTLAELQKIIKK